MKRKETMKNKVIILLCAVLILIIGAFGGIIYWGQSSGQARAGVHSNSSTSSIAGGESQANTTGGTYEIEIDNQSPMDKKISDLRQKVLTDLRADERLKVNMIPMLRTYRDMLKLLNNYAKKVETDIEILKQISKNEFQEDISLQAALFKGKKASLVAQHLEEFNAGRVGAILAKMKDAEASKVLDIWAQPQDPELSKFYRAVMAAYLQNKRRDANPEFYQQLSEKAERLNTNETAE